MIIASRTRNHIKSIHMQFEIIIALFMITVFFGNNLAVIMLKNNANLIHQQTNITMIIKTNRVCLKKDGDLNSVIYHDTITF